MRSLYNYFKSKSIKQRIAICFVVIAMLVFLFFVIKGNLYDIPTESQDTEQSGSPQFHVSLVDMGVLAAVIIAYISHKIHEKRKQKRM